jgi:penicillin-binding protein 1C
MTKQLIRWCSGAIGATLVVVYVFSLTRPLFNNPYSCVLEDRNGQLLGASVATDGQWRFPEQHRIPEKFRKAIIVYEDKRFQNHWGIDFFSLARAIIQNIEAGKIVSGGSTLTMQTIRLSRKNKPRTFFQKTVEMVLATRLEIAYSKEEILALYSSHAPFGGNVVGLEAACWRYLGRKPDELSWAEACMLAVLPNTPALIHINKNRVQLQLKRNKLLDRLAAVGEIDSLTLKLAKNEPLPEATLPLPNFAPHLLQRVKSTAIASKKNHTTIDGLLQQNISDLVWQHHQRLSGNRVHNAAVLVAEVNSGKVLAYIGNAPSGQHNHDQVDIIQSPRSSGSILKPFLYAALLDDGKILPHALQPDIPMYINGFAPENFSHELDGAVSASQALIRSLNIPAVHELKMYRYERFYELLKRLGFTTISKPADHYGLSLILGGAEVTLWEVTSAYASAARTLNQYFEHPGKNRYSKMNIRPLSFLTPFSADSLANEQLSEESTISAASIYTTFEVLKELYRPGEQTGWRMFSNQAQIAWKTGTSHGFRDAWAVGVNPDYVIGVWVGNADGEGRPGLTGTEAAAPLLFDVLSLLPRSGWFQKPMNEMTSIATCAMSGYRLSEFCPMPDTIVVPSIGLTTTACTFHQKIHLSTDEQYRVNSSCVEPFKMITKNWLVLPPIQEYYYRKKHSQYQTLPPLKAGCAGAMISPLDIIYPEHGAKVFIPKELDGQPGRLVLHALARNDQSTVYWHIDGEFKKTTHHDHKWSVYLPQGRHNITIMDENGAYMERFFEVVSK